MQTEAVRERIDFQQDLVDHIKIGGIYYHYKNRAHHYRVLILARKTDDLGWAVIYETLYNNPAGKIWCRTLEEFLGTVDVEGKTISRFTFIR